MRGVPLCPGYLNFFINASWESFLKRQSDAAVFRTVTAVLMSVTAGAFLLPGV